MATGPLEGLFAAGESGLADQSEVAAIDFAEFFVPFEGTREKLESEAIRVGGHAAHRTQFRIEPDEERDVFVEAVVIDLGDDDAFAWDFLRGRYQGRCGGRAGAWVVERLILVTNYYDPTDKALRKRP